MCVWCGLLSAGVSTNPIYYATNLSLDVETLVFSFWHFSRCSFGFNKEERWASLTFYHNCMASYTNKTTRSVKQVYLLWHFIWLGIFPNWTKKINWSQDNRYTCCQALFLFYKIEMNLANESMLQTACTRDYSSGKTKKFSEDFSVNFALGYAAVKILLGRQFQSFIGTRMLFLGDSGC